VRRTDRAPAQSFAHVALERAAVFARRRKVGQRACSADEPESRRIDSDADARVAALQANQRRDRNAEPLGLGALRFAAAQPRDREVLAEACQCLGYGRGQGLQRSGALWHDKEFTKLPLLINFI